MGSVARGWGQMILTPSTSTLQPPCQLSTVTWWAPSLHAHDGLLHFGDVRDVVLIGLELLLLNPLVDASHQLPEVIGTIIHT